METKPLINIDDYSKLEIRIGHVLKVELIPDADKLLRLEVDFGLKQSLVKDLSPEDSESQNVSVEERDIRQIVSGIKAYYPNLEDLVGTKCAFLVNLEPRVIRGLESQGMILAASTAEGEFSLLKVSNNIPAGTKIK